MKFRTSRQFLAKLARRRSARLLSVALASGGFLATSVVQAANYYWDPNQTNTDPGSGGTGIWNTSSTFWKLQGTSGNVVWPNTTAHTADFAGAAGTVTMGSAITAGGLIFDTAGYSLNTSTFVLTLGGSGIVTNNTSGTTTISSGTGGSLTSATSATWTVATGGTLQLNSNFTSTSTAVYQLNSNGTTNIAGTFSVTGKATLAGTGIINLSGTESFNSASTDYVGIAGVTVNNTAGTATFSPGTGNGFFIGNTGTAQGSTLNVTGGTVSVSSATRVFIGDGFNGTAVAGDGTLSVGGGAGAALFTLGTTTNATATTLGSSLATGTINLNTNGTFAGNRNIAAGATGKGIINFNGGTFQATGTAAAIASTITANVAEGGAIIDSQGFAITLANGFNHGGTAATDGGIKIASTAATPGAVTLSGTLAQTGGLTANTAALISGNNTYTGATVINAFVDGQTNGTFLGATGAGNGTTINTGGTIRFRDTGNKTIAEAITFNGGTFYTYNDPGTTTLSGLLTLNAATTISVSPQAQTSTVLALSGGIVDGTTLNNNVAFSRIGAAAAASSDVLSITGASTYGGTTAITDALNTNTGNFSVRLSGGNNRLPTGTVVTLGGTAGGGVAAGSGRLVLGDTTSGAMSQTLAGLVTSGTGTRNAVVGGAAAVSTLNLNIASGTNTFGGLLGGAATNENNLALTKSGAGTLALTTANTYTGATTITNGTLALNFNATGAPATNILPSASGLVMAGGTLSVLAKSGTATSQTVSGVTINSGGSAISVSPAVTNPNAVVLNLGAIARNSGGTVNFTLPSGGQNSTYGITTTSANTASSILGGWATVGLNDWAVSAGNGTTAGNITALGTYFVYDNVSGLVGAGVNSTSNLTDNNGYDATYTNNVTVNSLRFNAGGSDSNFGIVNGNSLTVNSGGILVTNNAGAKYQRIGFLNGSFNAGEGQGGITLPSAGDLIVNQNNSGTGHLEIYATIYGTGVNLVKSGVGYLDLRGLDESYTGSTVVNGGTMQLTAAVTATSSVVINNTGTVLLGASNRINNAATVTLAGGTLNLNGKSEGAAGTSGVGALTLTSTSTLDFGTTGTSNLIQFAGLGTHTTGAILQVTDWEGTAGNASGTDRLLFAGSTSDFTSLYSQTDVSFNGVLGYGVTSFSGYYEVFGVVAVPEPATWAAGVLMLGAVGYEVRRRMTRRAA